MGGLRGKRDRKGRVEEWEGWEGMGVNRKRRQGRKKDGWMGREGKKGDFQKFEILTAGMLCIANLHHRAKFRAGRSSRSGDMAVYWIFQNGGRLPSWIFKSWKFELPVPFGRPKCVIVPNFVQIGRTVVEIWPFTIFQDGEFWLAGSYRRRNHPCQILWQTVQGLQSSDTPILPFSIGIAGRPYNSVSTTVLHCDHV